MKIIISAPHRRDNYSVHQLHQNIAAVLSSQHEVITMPSFTVDASLERQAWIEQHYKNCELLITSNPQVIQAFREAAWTGTVILNHLGDLPRGAVGLRAALPYLKTTDILWCSSSSDQVIIERMLDKRHLPIIKVLAYGVKDSIFSPHQNKQSYRTLLGWKHDEFILVYAGRITAEKNIHALYEALFYLKCFSELKFRLVLVGQLTDAPFYEFNLRFSDLGHKLQELIRKYELEDNITYIPWLSQEDMNVVFNAADLFVNLTLHHDENFGFSQVEAMSAGLPVVCTAWGGLKDTVIDNECGFTCRTWVTSAGIRYDLPKFVQSVYKLATNDALRRAQAEAARARVMKHFSQTCFAQGILQLVEYIILRNKKPSESSSLTFSSFGQHYNERFSTFYDKYQRQLPSIPVYNGFADSDYQAIISAYTSGHGNQKQQLFYCLSGEIRGQYYYSHDLLWQIRTPITSEERDLLKLLNRSSYTMIQHDQSRLIDQLLLKGLVGYGHQ